MTARIQAIDYYLPEQIVDNNVLASEFKEWDAEKIEGKTGIKQRHIAAPTQCASDLAVAAAQKLLKTTAVSPEAIDFLLFCSQSPDYPLPTTACLLQHRLGLPNSCGALDFNLGCSGYIYGLSLAKGLIETGQCRNVLLLTAETYSKYIHPTDRSVRTIFGDAAAATLVSESRTGMGAIGPFVLGTDGSGAENLIVRTGASRQSVVQDATLVTDETGSTRTVNHLFMNGPEIFNFTLRVVPNTVSKLLEKAGKEAQEIDLWVFHQANLFMLEHLRKKLQIPREKFLVHIADCGNTVSATIPIALREASSAGRLSPGNLVMLVGFGVGYSWGGTLVRWE